MYGCKACEGINPQQPNGCEEFILRSVTQQTCVLFESVVVALANVTYTQLHVGIAPVVVLHYGIADVERVAGLDVVERT